jgi:hypothetical protein
MALFSDATPIDLEKQVAMLSREIASMKRAAAKRGNAYYEDGREVAWDYYSDLMERISDHLPSLRRRARALESTARDHPATTAAVGLVVLGLLATMVLRRR